MSVCLFLSAGQTLRYIKMCFDLIIMTIAVDSLCVCLSLSLSVSVSVCLSVCQSVGLSLPLSLRPLSQSRLSLVTSAVFHLEKIPHLLCKNHHYMQIRTPIDGQVCANDLGTGRVSCVRKATYGNWREGGI